MLRLVGAGLIGNDRLEAWEADLLRREQELRKDKPDDPPPPMSW